MGRYGEIRSCGILLSQSRDLVGWMLSLYFLLTLLAIFATLVQAQSGGDQSSGCSKSMAVDAETQFHVLAVDDSLLDRKLIERLLKTSSFQVTTVDSGSKALEFLGLREDQPPEHNEIEVNLVITDYCMPGMTGYDLLKKIKESSSLKDIPVVIMSSENVPSRINRCLEGGAEEFFLKPVQLSDLKRLRPHILKGKSKEQDKENTTVISTSTGTTSSSGSNKRKAMAIDEDLAPNKRTRLRFSSSNSSLTLV